MKVQFDRNPQTDTNRQCITRYIKHLADSADFKGGTFNKHRNGLIGNRFEMPNVSYTHPLCTSGEKTTTQQIDNENGILNLV